MYTEIDIWILRRIYIGSRIGKYEKKNWALFEMANLENKSELKLLQNNNKCSLYWKCWNTFRDEDENEAHLK